MPEPAGSSGIGAIPVGRGKLIEVAGRQIALFNDNGTYQGIDDRCPHAGGSLSSGWIEDGAVVCPLHRWRFRLTDGRRLDGDGPDVSHYHCTVIDGKIEIRLGSDPGSVA